MNCPLEKVLKIVHARRDAGGDLLWPFLQKKKGQKQAALKKKSFAGHVRETSVFNTVVFLFSVFCVLFVFLSNSYCKQKFEALERQTVHDIPFLCKLSADVLGRKNAKQQTK